MLIIAAGTSTIALAQTTPAEKSPAATAPAASEPPVDPKLAEKRADYDKAFQATLDNPSDPAVLMKFAELALVLGDVEGAISAFERLLLIDGDQPEVKLELGVLYYRLGSVDVARAYLEQVRDAPSADADVKERAATFLRSGMKH